MINKLCLLRAKNNLSQKEVAKAIKKTTSYYGMLETGKRKPSIEVAYLLAKFYKTTIEEIFFVKSNN
ncbi:XRE family transcriptional regulator [Clostridium chromiireducens]|uniref:XRE family transcriptional regulator n=1 Tax=Clostridium chromiireducens TaxID=225345 RepID=A0A399IN01_9CLOT|nr:helix-turn-helix transcriptional regulator [Clostridium chromiireducens]RII32822.1 XRE family transcriptional regulator [Clostridium chromiireducens]